MQWRISRRGQALVAMAKRSSHAGFSHLLSPSGAPFSSEQFLVPRTEQLAGRYRPDCEYFKNQTCYQSPSAGSLRRDPSSSWPCPTR